MTRRGVALCCACAFFVLGACQRSPSLYGTLWYPGDARLEAFDLESQTFVEAGAHAGCADVAADPLERTFALACAEKVCAARTPSGLNTR